MPHRLAAVGAALTFITACLAAAVLVTLAPGANAAAPVSPACEAAMATGAGASQRAA